MKKTANIIFIVIVAIAALLVVLGIINACQKVPVGTTYHQYRWGNNETFEYVCKFGNNYEYKNKQTICTGKYVTDEDTITFLNVQGCDVTMELDRHGISGITVTLIAVGVAMLLVDYVAYVIYRHQKISNGDWVDINPLPDYAGGEDGPSSEE